MYRLNSLGVVHLIDEMREAGTSDAIAVLAARIAAAALSRSEIGFGR